MRYSNTSSTFCNTDTYTPATTVYHGESTKERISKSLYPVMI